MKILLVGSNGQLGSDLIRSHQEYQGVTIHPLTRTDLDLAQLDRILPTLEKIDFDVLINATAFNRVDAVEDDEREAFLINDEAVGLLTQAAQNKKARFVHVSSDYVFDGKADRPYREEDMTGPINRYGASKLAGEQKALQNCEQSFILRTASLFGVSGSSSKGGNFIETILSRAKSTGVVKVVNDITMSPTSTADLAHMILKLLVVKAAPGIYHAVNSGAATWFDFAREAITRSGVGAEVIPVPSSQFPTKARRPAFSVLDNSKISSLIGTPATWQDALNRYLKEKGHCL